MRQQESYRRHSHNSWPSPASHISTFIFMLLALTLFGATPNFAQGGASQARLSSAHLNGKIAFTSSRDGNLEIYSMNADGTGQVRLTNNPGRDDLPTWSPDGRRIAFVSENAGGGFSIKLMNADGTNQTPLTPIAFNNNQNFPWYSSFSLSWSPDGAKIAFQEAGDIWTIHVDGSNRINLTNHQGANNEPSWSPDGSRIAFTSNRTPNTISAIHTMNADGSNVVPLLNGALYQFDSGADWARDGSNRIVYMDNTGADPSSLIFMSAEGTNRHFIDYSYPDQDSYPKWSPDGTEIVFYRINSDIPAPLCQIYKMKPDGSGLTQLTTSSPNNFNPAWQPRPPASARADFDGDGKSDLSVFRNSEANWYLQRSSAGASTTQFGLSGDKITPADFDGDGKTDIAVFRNGIWYLLRSQAGFTAIPFGLATDIPVPADFDGDGQAELAVFRDGTWYSLNLANNQTDGVQFGIASDRPVAADFDGDGRDDHAVYRDGMWYVLASSQGFMAIQFGYSTDKAVVGDYDGDGRADEAVYRNGVWYQLRSQTGATSVQFGLASDVPVPADYDGDGRTDVAVYRDGTWYLLQSAAGTSTVQFGLANDTPVPSASVQ